MQKQFHIVAMMIAALFAGSQAAQAAVPPHVPATPVAASASDNSVNWAGYVATGGKYTSVSGTWVVPSISDPSPNSADTTWVGIGGSVTNDLIQAGTEEIPDLAGNLQYQAWYEALPGDSIPVPLSISPGDSVSVMLTKESGDTWLVNFRNNTTGKSYSTTVPYRSSLSSAEWIEEVPVVVGQATALDQFGMIPFTGGYTIKDGKPMTIAQAHATPLTMNNDAREPLAVPSVLSSDGMSFSVSRTPANSNAIALTPYGLTSVSDTPSTSVGSQVPGGDGLAVSIPVPIVPVIRFHHGSSSTGSPWQVIVFQW